PQKSEDIRLLEQILVCKACWIDFHHELDQDDLQSIKYFTNGKEKETLLKYQLYKEKCIRFRKILS
ncbi:4418_t:CDS:1, partial [Dentiscutata heterogama]